METAEKIFAIGKLAEKCAALRAQGKTIVQCHGTFDLMHPGHICHFQDAKKFGDVLVVTITPDAHVRKGPGRPVFTEQVRAEVIAALECVDLVAIDRNAEALEAISIIKPHVYVKGCEYAGQENDPSVPLGREKQVLDLHGGRVRFVDERVKCHSSQLLNRLFSPLPAETQEFIGRIRQKYSPAYMTETLNRMQKLRVLVVGDSIIDEYRYAVLLGRPSKERISKVRVTSSETFAGGAIAVANILAGFCDEVGFASVIGCKDPDAGAKYEKFIRDRLAPNVNSTFFRNADAPTFVNTRFVDEATLEQFFGICETDGRPVLDDLAGTIARELESLAPKYDLVLIMDYGHGMLTPAIIRRLERDAKFLAVNAQINSANEGFNHITKYEHVDYVSLSERELRLAFQDRFSPLETIMHAAAEYLGAHAVSVTQANRGSKLFYNGEIYSIPVFPQKVADKTGAGDAYISVTAPLVALGDIPAEIIGFLGNISGAIACTIVGHRESVDREMVQRHLQNILR
jgi:rfaE bifunctional protein nucleotidyltransferase chain/domain